ncbi:polyhydroxybutyrate depolymerase [Glaciihabitans tibetensis]|uniref:Polyhydroxybutyrate depolymerase n=1 Tax=Glaciihabitans tibetensis TaxID=1266600 RepID=A0A2T0VI57_9MICO|nr:alpha/beta fold hydrolase [Glaciihabitans tibetensis]PRY69733.1 polyhydroxybutyrate depolymerase [Glaciihabitans tibetensis]
MKALAIFFASFVLVVLAGCTASSAVLDTALVPAASQSVSLSVNGQARSVTFRAPEREPGTLLPVIVALHGLGGTAQNFEDYTGLSDNASRDGYIAVYPDGSPIADKRQAWNAGECCNSPGRTPQDDVALLSRIFDQVEQYGGDPARIYVVGFSNGGMLSYRAACDLGDRVAGIAVVGGAFNVTDCRSTNPIPVVIIHGTGDTTVPYLGGRTDEAAEAGLNPVDNASVWDAMEYWLARNDCSFDATETGWNLTSIETFDDCAPGASVAVYTIDGGGHVWPDAKAPVDATRVILESFIR